MADDECEEWPEATTAAPKRVIRMRGRIRRIAPAVDVLCDGDERIRDAVAQTLDAVERGLK
ncbi:MAG: hypothetical protein MUF00_01560 [Gemmatimonadaceae bacterium]|jgi:hypothetical protein|nr:hypothetical protein [Gemmatimonadaceae bacterium]